MYLGDSPNGVGPQIQEFRRSSRRAATFAVWLRNEQNGPIWEEETETHIVSRYGAGLYCRHLVRTGTVLVIVRRDDGRRANARVRYSRYHPHGKRELGVEFLDKDNYWGLDWNLSGPKPPTLPSMTIPGEVRAESAPTAVVDRNSNKPGETTLLLPPIAKALVALSAPPAEAEAEKADVAPRPVIDESAAGTNPSPTRDATGKEVPQFLLVTGTCSRGETTMEDPVRSELGYEPKIHRLFMDDAFFDRVQEIRALIARRAYDLFESGGRMHGSDREHWIRAESQILHPLSLEITEAETEISVRGEVPGFGAKDLEIGVTPRRLFILGERRDAPERRDGKTVRSGGRCNLILGAVELSSMVDPDRVSATVDKGLLEVTLAKAQVAKISVLAKAASA